MATYTDKDVFLRDFYPSSDDDNMPRLVARAAAIAYNYINSRLANTFTVPFTVTYPGEIVDISDMLTRCLVKSLVSGRAPLLPKPGAVQRDAAHNECTLAVLWLDDLASGASGIVGLGAASDLSSFTRDHVPIFDVDDSTAHHPSNTLLDEIDDEREAEE